MFSKFFIDRPIFATVVSIVIVLLGAIALPILPIEKTPDITPPTVVVEAHYPGASAEIVAETVAIPLEEQINGVDNMLYMSSVSSDDGSMQLTVTFEVGTDVDMATVLVQNRVSMAESTLPEDVIRQGITTRKRSTSFVMIVNLISPDDTYDRIYISNYITLNIKDVITRIEGVGDVMLFGAQDFGMRIWMDPEKLKARNLTTQDIVNAVEEQNIQVAAGQIGTPPIAEGQQFQYTLKTLGRLKTPEEFEDIILKVSDGKILRLKDVARIELGAQTYSFYTQLDKKYSIGIGVFQLPGANAINVSNEVHKAMKDLAKNFPKDLEYRIDYDTTEYIKASIKEVIQTIFITVFLVILIVFIFLEDFRATLIPAITIPVSLIGTFAVMYALGVSINSLSLFGLILVIGIVVDDAIVVVENTMRIIDEENLPPKQAATKAMTQITGPVIATTLVLLAVFIPTGLIGGVSGMLYSQFAITISVATVFSSINALTLSPALCGIFLRPTQIEKRNIFFRAFNSFFKKTTNGYMVITNKIIRNTFYTIVIFLVMILLTIAGFKILPSGFLPDEDEGFFFLQAQLPDGASLERTQNVLDRINDVLADTKGVRDFVTIGGYSILDGTLKSNSGFCVVILDDWSKRKSLETSIENIVEGVQNKMFAIQDAFVFAFRPPPIMGLGFAGGFQFQLQDRADLGFDMLQKAGDDLRFAGMNDPVIARINSSFSAAVPQYFIDINRTKAKTLEVPMTNIFQALQAYLGSQYINDFNLFGRTFKVLAQADFQFRNNINDVLNLEVRNVNGDMVPLRTLVKIEQTSGPQVVNHFNLYPSVSISGAAKPGISSGQAMQRVKDICTEKLPAGMNFEWSGMSYQEIEAGQKAIWIFIMAIVFVYLFLAAQYESWSIPFAILLTVPIALFGAVALTWLRSYDNNTYTQIGLVLLIGLASKTAILLVEFAKKEHEKGRNIIEAASAAAKLRFRPILMTALTFVLGVVPLVIASGAGAVSRRALGTAVFGGMLIATIAGVFMMPVLYVVIQKFAEKTKKLEQNREEKIPNQRKE